MKLSAIRTWALAAIAASGLLSATGAHADKTAERLRDDHRRQSPADPEPAVRSSAGMARVATAAQPAAQALPSAANDESIRATVRRYIPLAVPGAAVFLLVCIAMIWRLMLWAT